MARIFISHSSANNAAAVALCEWLSDHGYDDVFLDIDVKRGLLPGDRWQAALKAAADRCESVLFLISPAWLSSRWCRNEFDLARLLHKRIFGVVVETVPLSDLPVDMTAEWQLCQLVGEGDVRAFDVKLESESCRIEFREAGLDILRRGLARVGLDARSFSWPPKDEPLRAPYRGLKALEPQDAAIFFGRDALNIRCLDEIRGVVESGVEKLFVVLGASGSGKSSFLRAGLWPRLARDDASFLPLPVIRPQLNVISGTAGLAASLATAFGRLGTPRPPGAIKQRLNESGEALGELLDELLVLTKRRLVATEEASANPTVVIALDQAEELFNPDGAAEATRFLQILGGVLAPAPGKPARKVLAAVTIRSDRYETLQNEPHLQDARQHLFNLPPIPQSEFKSVIEGPAARVEEAGGRIKIEPALTERLIADAQGADALPLLGFTLERLFADYGSGGQLTAGQYDTLGGVQGSIQAAIQNAFAEPGRAPMVPATVAEQMACLRAAFVPWLARIDPKTGAPMRRVARLDEIPQGSRSVIERLVEARLVIADARGGVEVREVAHESLLRQWSALTAWLAEDAADLVLVEGIERASGEWMLNGRADSWLDHRGDRLSTAEKLLKREDFHKRLGDNGVAYLAACRQLEEAQRKLREEALAREEARLAQIAAAQTRTAQLQRRARWTLAAVAVAILIGFGVGLWLLWTNLTLRASLDKRLINLIGEMAAVAQARGNLDSALRLAVYGARLELELAPNQTTASRASAELATARLLADWRLVLHGHTDVVNSTAFSPDDSRIVTASSDKTARVWDAANGKQLLVFSNHGDAVNSAAYSPDGRRIVTASSDKTARIWDAETGRELVVLRGHDIDVRSAAFNFDATLVVTTSSDKTARIFDAATGREIGPLLGHTAFVDCAAFNPDGTRIVTGSGDKTAAIWEVATLRRISVLGGHSNNVTSVMYSPDGSQILTGSSDNTARIWDAATAAEVAEFRSHKSDVSSAVFSPDAQRVLTASADNTALIWDVARTKEIALLRGHEDGVRAAAFSHSGLRVVTASADRTARVWDPMSSHELLALHGHADAVNTAVFSRDGSRIVTASDDKRAIVWASASGKKIVELVGHEDLVRSAEFSPDGRRVVTASNDMKALIWDVSAAEPMTRPMMALEGHGDAVRWAAFSPDGKRVVTASADRTARVWDAASGKTILILRGHGDIVRSAFFSPDGSRVVTASNDKAARVWNAATGALIATLNGHGGIVTFAEFSPDGRRVVTASFDNSARIWDLATATEVAALQGHEDIVRSATFSPDGSRVTTASVDGTTRVWDVSSAIEIALLRAQESSAVTFATFSPDGSRIVTASWDKTARIWDARFAVMPEAGLVTEVCTQRLPGISQLTGIEMRLAGYPDNISPIDACGQTIALHN